jgi:small-conductance mechanosensitive channel
LDGHLESLISIIEALLPLVAAYLLVRLVVEPSIDRVARRAGVSTAIASFWKTLALVMALAVALMMTLAQLGARAELFYASYILLGLALLSLVLGSRDVVANVVASYAILIHKPFRRGDSIAIGGVAGTVRDVGTIYTQVVSEQGILYIPNREFLRNTVLNRQASSLTRVALSIKVRASEDLERVEKAMLKAAEECVEELTVPPEPEVLVTDITGEYSEVQLAVHVTNPRRVAHVASELRKKIRDELNREGIALY